MQGENIRWCYHIVFMRVKDSTEVKCEKKEREKDKKYNILNQPNTQCYENEIDSMRSLSVHKTYLMYLRDAGHLVCCLYD